MKTKIFASFLIITFIAGFFTCALSLAADINAVKANMEKRLPLVVELKSKGIVGEDNNGYLQFVGGKREKEATVEAENQDRKEVYQVIAKKERVSVEQVGQRRALQIINKARKGEWLQDPNGKWYQK
ncbi:MAG: YdbL family protein [Planctomycetia bacterium]|nr:YdbL family protein [Planctomycetia bacterium]